MEGLSVGTGVDCIACVNEAGEHLCVSLSTDGLKAQVADQASLWRPTMHVVAKTFFTIKRRKNLEDAE